MNKTRFTLQAFAFLVVTLAFASATHAQATRTWVSGVGDDVNPCSRTAPCKTFAGAISKTADGGEIDCIDSAGFGAVTIQNKGITIDGAATLAGVLTAGTSGIIFNDTTNTKVARLRNLSIVGVSSATNGVRFLAGKALYVENCQIFGFKGSPGHGIDVSLTTAGGQLLMVKDCNIQENAGDGIHLANSAPGGAVNAFVDNTRIERNNVGIRVGAVSVLTLRNSSLNFNTASNLRVENASSSANVANSSFQGSPGDGVIATSGNVRLHNNDITNNGASGVNCAGGTISSFFDNAIAGNGNNIVGCTDPLPQLLKK